MADTKICNVCGDLKPLDQFSRGRRTCCTCRAAEARRQRAENPQIGERDREASRLYRQKHPERQRAAERRWQAAHRDHFLEIHRRRREVNRNAVLDHYGHSCACCGSMDRLGIDHIDGDGKEHRAEIGVRTGTEMNSWLVKSGFPEGFQTLCGPCNTSKGRGERCRLDHAAASAA